MTKEKPLPQKVLWPIVIVTVFGVILFAVLLENMDAAGAAPDPLAPPTFSVPPGRYDQSLYLSMGAPRGSEGQVIYTVNGRSPTPDSAELYDDPIPLNAEEPKLTTIRARTILPDGSLSDEVIGTYALGIETDLPLVSLITDPENLWSAERGIFANRIMRGAKWERPAHLTLINEDGDIGFSEGVGIRLHGQGSSFSDKKSLRLYFRREYGAGRLNYPVFPENEIVSFDRLVLHNGGQDNAFYSGNWTLMRTQLMAKLAREIKAHSTYNQPVLLFLNGELYGIYNIRERLDETYFQDHFGIDNVKILNSPYLDPDQPEDIEDWWALENYAVENDMADPEHYAKVLAQIDVDNMIDHFILQMYAANNDWPHNNDTIFRSDDPLARWQWFLWDVDYSFGMLPASSVEFDMVTWLFEPEHTRVQAATRLFRNLWHNQDFRNRFLVRTADLLNTTLSPENVSMHLAEIEAEMVDDIGYEIARWGSASNWYDSSADMYAFAEQRADIMRQHFVGRLNLRGTAVLTLNTPTNGKGTLILNDALTPDLPYSGEYFLDTIIQITAQPDEGYQFTGWEIDGEKVEEETAVLRHTLTQDTNIAPQFTKN